MQQRQPRLGDVLDDYCPRERRVTNHVVVAMVGEDVKQTRCTTCDADHEYKHARVPRQRRKDAPAALSSGAAAPKRIAHETAADGDAPPSSPPAPNGSSPDPVVSDLDPLAAAPPPAAVDIPEPDEDTDSSDLDERAPAEEGPAHRRLIRATLPRIEGQAPPARPGPDFTIRQPNSRQRFRNPRGMSFHQNRSGNSGGDGMSRQGGRRPPVVSRQAPRHGPQHGGGRKRSK